jgi:hypothetical protein
MKERTFKGLVEAVEENNKMNNGKWSDWKDAWHIEEVYGELEDDFDHVARAFLDELIGNEGKNKSYYIDAMCALNYGYVFNE